MNTGDATYCDACANGTLRSSFSCAMGPCSAVPEKMRLPVTQSSRSAGDEKWMPVCADKIVLL
jgi:hypothetical protein